MTRRYSRRLKTMRPPLQFPRKFAPRQAITEPDRSPIDFQSSAFREYSGEVNGIRWQEYYDGSWEMTLAHFVADQGAYDDLAAFTDEFHLIEPLGYPAPPFPAKPRPFEQSDYGRIACADLRAYFDVKVTKSHEAYVITEDWNDRGYAFELDGQYHFHWWCTSA